LNSKEGAKKEVGGGTEKLHGCENLQTCANRNTIHTLGWYLLTERGVFA
jgi:hypothetical protein